MLLREKGCARLLHQGAPGNADRLCMLLPPGRWLLELGAELEERIAADRAANARVPRLLTVRHPP